MKLFFLVGMVVACSSSFGATSSNDAGVEHAGGEGGEAPMMIDAGSDAPNAEVGGEGGGAPIDAGSALAGGEGGEGAHVPIDASCDECNEGERQCGADFRAERCDRVAGCAVWVELVPPAVCMPF